MSDDPKKKTNGHSPFQVPKPATIGERLKAQDDTIASQGKAIERLEGQKRESDHDLSKYKDEGKGFQGYVDQQFQHIRDRLANVEKGQTAGNKAVQEVVTETRAVATETRSQSVTLVDVARDASKGAKETSKAQWLALALIVAEIIRQIVMHFLK